MKTNLLIAVTGLCFSSVCFANNTQVFNGSRCASDVYLGNERRVSDIGASVLSVDNAANIAQYVRRAQFSLRTRQVLFATVRRLPIVDGDVREWDLGKNDPRPRTKTSFSSLANLARLGGKIGVPRKLWNDSAEDVNLRRYLTRIGEVVYDGPILKKAGSVNFNAFAIWSQINPGTNLPIELLARLFICFEHSAKLSRINARKLDADDQKHKVQNYLRPINAVPPLRRFTLATGVMLFGMGSVILRYRPNRGRGVLLGLSLLIGGAILALWSV